MFFFFFLFSNYLYAARRLYRTPRRHSRTALWRKINELPSTDKNEWNVRIPICFVFVKRKFLSPAENLFVETSFVLSPKEQNKIKRIYMEDRLKNNRNSDGESTGGCWDSFVPWKHKNDVELKMKEPGSLQSSTLI